MTLQIHTGRVSRRDPDTLNITRLSGGDTGDPFAPSWAILGPALRARREADAVRRSDPTAAERIEREAWERYVPQYEEEMRASYRTHRDAWDALLRRPRVVLVCYCVDPARCHRRLLAGLLVRCGAVDHGELAS